MQTSTVQTNYEHIILDENNVPVISGTTMKVIEIVLEKTAYGWSPEEIHFQHPFLTLGQIYSALAYYWDHRNELDRDIEDRLDFVAGIQKETGETKLVKKLKARGLI